MLVQVLPSTRDHLAKYNCMDISLDTFPYAGTTTTVEALLMGVPVVTLRATGQEATHAQNVGVSLLTQVGCTELIANNEDQFVEIAVNLARSPQRMRALRETLRQRLLASPLCDGPRYMVQVENQYRRMWRRYCEEEPELQHSEKSDAGVEHEGSVQKDAKDAQLDQSDSQDKQAALGTSDMDREGGEDGAGQMDGEGIDGDMERQGGSHDREMEREIMKMERGTGDGEQGGHSESDADASSTAAVRGQESLVEGVAIEAERSQEGDCRGRGDLTPEGHNDGSREPQDRDSGEGSEGGVGGENVRAGTNSEREGDGGGTREEEKGGRGEVDRRREGASSVSSMEDTEGHFSDARAACGGVDTQDAGLNDYD